MALLVALGGGLLVVVVSDPTMRPCELVWYAVMFVLPFKDGAARFHCRGAPGALTS